MPGIELAHECVVHNRVDVKDGGASLRDAVFFDSDGVNCAGELLLNFSADGHSYSVVSVWHARPTANPAIATYGVEHTDARIIHTSALGVALCRCDASDGTEISVIVPWSWRTA